MNELKPCPFCGCLSMIHREGSGYHVRCNYDRICGAIGPWKNTKEGAITAWNQRATTEQEPVGGLNTRDDLLATLSMVYRLGKEGRSFDLAELADAIIRDHTHPKPPTLHERDEDGNWICCCGDSLPASEAGESQEGDRRAIDPKEKRPKKCPGWMNSLVSSIWIMKNPHHWRITVFNRGGNAGTLTVNADDGPDFVRRLSASDCPHLAEVPHD